MIYEEQMKRFWKSISWLTKNESKTTDLNVKVSFLNPIVWLWKQKQKKTSGFNCKNNWNCTFQVQRQYSLYKVLYIKHWKKKTSKIFLKGKPMNEFDDVIKKNVHAHFVLQATCCSENIKSCSPLQLFTWHVHALCMQPDCWKWGN